VAAVTGAGAPLPGGIPSFGNQCPALVSGQKGQGLSPYSAASASRWGRQVEA
jgi:hypothetical protein